MSIQQKWAEHFQGKKILITGGSKGLGFATAQLFAQGGAAEIFLSYRSDEKSALSAANQIRELGVRCEIIQSDLSENSGSETLFSKLSELTSSLDVYIHNAAATSFKNLMEIQAHHVDKTMNISVKSFILGVQFAASLMKSGGAIVSVSGMDTLRAVPRHGLLGAAKSALETLSAYFAHELAQQGIRVNSINPGFFSTESTQIYLGPLFDTVQKQFASSTPLKRPATLENIADVILFLCSDYSKWIVGQTLYADGGYQFALPKFI